MAERNFNAKQALEREVKDLYAQIVPSAAATATLDLTTDVVLTSAAFGASRNDTTFELVVEAAAANPDDEVLVDFTGTAAAIICTVTPNDGTNNPGDAAEAVLDLTADITLTSAAAGAARNTNTFTIEVEAAAANPTDTVLVDFTGTAAAIVCTVTPNDGTNNGATPVDLTTAELVELINTGAVVGKTITLTDASSLRNDQTAAGGGATALASGGEGDGVVGTFADGTNIPVSLDEDELAELINTGAVAGKTITLTDGDDLRELQTASGGAASNALVEADSQEVSFGSGVTASLANGYGFVSVSRTSAGVYQLVLDNAFASVKHIDAIYKRSTAEDISFQISAEAVATSSSKTFSIVCLTGATPTDPNSAGRIMIKAELKNTA